MEKNIISCKTFQHNNEQFGSCVKGAIPDILQKTEEEYFSRIVGLLKEGADACCNKIKEIPSIHCPHKPEGSMFLMVTRTTLSTLLVRLLYIYIYIYIKH